MHSFIDSSGCVFLNTYSGETISVGLSQFELIELISSRQGSDNTHSNMDPIITLMEKGFLKSIDTQDLHVE